MRRRSSLDRLQDTKQPLLFVFFTYVLGVAVGSAQTVLESWFGAGKVALFGAGVILLLLLMEVPRWLIQWVQTTAQRSTLDVEKLVLNPPGHRGLIAVASVGGGISSAQQSIEYHLSKGTLEKCWIFTGGNESERRAREMVSNLVRNGVNPNLFEYVKLTAEEADNPDVICERVEAIFESLPEGWREDEIAADYTGGTKSMTAGIVLACAKPGRHLQFMRPREYDQEGRAVYEKGSDPVLVDINYKVRPVGRRTGARFWGKGSV